MLIACFTVFPADAADTIKSNTAIVATSFLIIVYPRSYFLAIYPDQAKAKEFGPKPYPCGIYHSPCRKIHLSPKR
jgi:hypothetical protein